MKTTAKQVRAIFKKHGFKEINAPKLTLAKAEKMGRGYWNEAIKLCAWISTAFNIEGLERKERRLVKGVQKYIAKEIRRNHWKLSD